MGGSRVGIPGDISTAAASEVPSLRALVGWSVSCIIPSKHCIELEKCKVPGVAPGFVSHSSRSHSYGSRLNPKPYKP